jgi:hypothetical protein
LSSTTGHVEWLKDWLEKGFTPSKAIPNLMFLDSLPKPGNSESI